MGIARALWRRGELQRRNGSAEQLGWKPRIGGNMGTEPHPFLAQPIGRVDTRPDLRILERKRGSRVHTGSIWGPGQLRGRCASSRSGGWYWSLLSQQQQPGRPSLVLNDDVWEQEGLHLCCRCADTKSLW